MAIRARTLVIAAVIAGGAYFAYTHFFAVGGGAGQGWGSGAPVPVSVAEVISREVQQWNEFSGRLVAVDQVEIRPRISGTIDEIHFKDGDKVKKGDLLFVIDPRPYEAALQSASARSGLAGSEFTRAGGLLKDKAIARREYDQRKNAADVARADLTTARLNLEYTRIRAPISGRVGRAEITAGNLVETGGGAPVLTTIVSSNPIYADFEMDEAAYLYYVQSGATGKRARQIPVMMGLASEEGAPHEGHIESFDNRLDNASGTLRVRAVFPNDDGALVPGLFARIRLGGPAGAETILITDRAVGTDQSKKFVLVVGADNKATYREVQLGATVEGLRVVRAGLKPGEKIIVNGIQRAHPGSEVKPEMVPMVEQKPEAGDQKPGAQKHEKP